MTIFFQHGRGETENEEEDDKVDEDGVQPDMLEQVRLLFTRAMESF